MEEEEEEDVFCAQLHVDMAVVLLMVIMMSWEGVLLRLFTLHIVRFYLFVEL